MKFCLGNKWCHVRKRDCPGLKFSILLEQGWARCAQGKVEREIAAGVILKVRIGGLRVMVSVIGVG